MEGAETEGVLGWSGLWARSGGLSVLVERALKRTAQKDGESAAEAGSMVPRCLARWMIIVGFFKTIRFDLEAFRCFGFRMPIRPNWRI